MVWTLFLFFNLEFDKKAISEAGLKCPVSVGGIRILSDFKELSFRGPFGPCFFNHIDVNILYRERVHGSSTSSLT